MHVPCSGHQNGCRKVITIPFEAFMSPTVLQSVLEHFDWYLLECTLVTEHDEKEVYAVTCLACARKELPPKDVIEIEARRAEWVKESS